jgi:hypothetical protein
MRARPATPYAGGITSALNSSRALRLGLIAMLVGLAACGAPAGTATRPSASSSPCAHAHVFSFSLAHDTGGQASPVAAAQWFTTHGSLWPDLPTTGWSVVGSSGSSTSVRSGSFTLDVVRGSDGTWQVDGGTDAAC